MDNFVRVLEHLVGVVVASDKFVSRDVFTHRSVVTQHLGVQVTVLKTLRAYLLSGHVTVVIALEI